MKKTQVYELKVKGVWVKVRARGIAALSRYAKENKIKDWRMVGMMSRREMLASKTLPIIKV